MPRRENWIKAHSEDNRTAALMRVSWAARGVWYALQLHTMDRCDSPGVLTRGRKAINLCDLALELHIEDQALREAIDELLAVGGLLERKDGGVLAFPNWNKRQVGNAASKRDAWRATKRGQRSTKHDAAPTEQLAGSTPLLRSLK